jgi:hypothetical protein
MKLSSGFFIGVKVSTEKKQVLDLGSYFKIINTPALEDPFNSS